MTEPTFDADGYPTEETLQAIESWPWQDAAGCLNFARAAWHWPDWANENVSASERDVLHADSDDRYARFATGGWSGNEDVIRALKNNQMVRSLTWRLSGRGGLHIFEYPHIKAAK